MKFKTKRIIGLILSFLMIISIFTVLPFTAGAVTTSVTSGDFEYQIRDNDTAETTKYIGKATNVKIPSKLDGHTVTSIGKWTFFNYESLEKVTIGNNIKKIGSMAFNNCKNLKSVIIPDSVTTIGNDAFCHCEGLKKVIIGNGVKLIDSGTFSYCKSLTSVTIGNHVKELGWDAFDNCKNLKSVTIPKSVKKISYSAFGSYLDDNSQWHLVDNFTIRGYRGTEAERYAKNKNFKFISIGTNIKLKKSSATIYVKGTTKIKATITKGKGKTTYRTSNRKIAKVSSNGKVTGVKKGKTAITVTNNGVSKRFKVTVKNPKLNKKKVTLNKGKSTKLVIKGKVGKTKFSSNNKKVATVSKKGNVKAKKKGTATITVKTNGIQLKCKVTVK